METIEASVPPSRGTRPRNRRALILAAASQLFAVKGYPQVGMTDVAEAVGVRPSALYRHFSSKEELLRDAITSFFLPYMEVLKRAASTSVDVTLAELAEVMLDHEWSGILWQRESRHLPTEVRGELAGLLLQAVSELTKGLRAHRQELDPLQAEILSWSAVAVTISGSFRDVGRSRAEDEKLLASLAGAAAFATIPTVLQAPSAAPADPAPSFGSRREALLRAATQLFAENGYAGVSLEDVGAAIGVTGPTVYGYFTSKSDLLVTALNRAEAVMWTDLSRSISLAHGPEDALRRLLACYSRFARENVDLMQLIRSEVPQLPDGQREVFAERQDQYFEEWARFLRVVRPDLSSASAEIHVRTTCHIINAIARRPHLCLAEGIDDALQVIGREVMQVT
jgi:AcrR family transcriptional regulator